MGGLHKRLKIVLVLMLLGITMTHATVTTNKLTLVDCSDDTWQMALESYKRTGNTLNIVADLAYSGNFTGHLHKVTLKMTGCGFIGRCRNVSYVNLEDVDCDAKVLSNMDRNACIITKSLATWEPLSGELNSQLISGMYGKICFTHEDVHIDWESSSSESDSTSSENSKDSSSSSGESTPEKPNSSSNESKGSHEKSNSSSKESKGSHEKSNSSSKEAKGSPERPDNSSKATPENPSNSSKESKDSKESPKDSSKETSGTSSDDSNASSKPRTGSSTESSTR